jgi:hypothetical protein
MLIISNKQMRVFEEASERRYMQKMILHVRQYFPERCKNKADNDLLGILNKGSSRAKSYGITEQRDICKYFNVMFVLGYDFDNDETYPWARRILHDTSLTSGSSKMIQLCNAVQDHIGKL